MHDNRRFVENPAEQRRPLDPLLNHGQYFCQHCEGKVFNCDPGAQSILNEMAEETKVLKEQAAISRDKQNIQ